MKKPFIPKIVLLLLLGLTACRPVASTPTQIPSTPTLLPTSTLPPPTQAPTATPTAISVEPTSSPQTTVLIYFISVGDEGRSGKLIGCNDSVVPVEFEIQPSDDPVKAALELLFSYKDQMVGSEKLYNALSFSNLSVDRIDTDPSGEAVVWLSGEYLLGGVCDDPRFIAQIEETVLAFDAINGVSVYINDVPLDEILSGK